jgi:hypothetical protein
MLLLLANVRRVVIYHPGESRLISKISSPESAMAMQLFDARRIHGSLFHGFHTKYPSFGPSVK